MTTEQEPVQTSTTEATIQSAAEPAGEAMPADANVELREALKREKEVSSGYRDELMDTRLEAIGLNKDEGLGKAIAKEYDGEMTVEAVSAYAQSEYSHGGGVETLPPAVETGNRLEQLSQTSEPVTPPPEVDKAAEITGKMEDPESGREEAEASVNAKMSQFAQEHYPT